MFWIGTTLFVLSDITVKMMAGNPDSDPDGGVDVQEKTRPKRPSMYRVVLLNDDYTPMDFVVMILETLFGMSRAKSVQIMMDVHQRGSAVVGVFSFEVAETKVTQVLDIAQRYEHPLKCVLEKEE